VRFTKKRIVHRIRPLCAFDRVKARRMGAMSRRQTKFSRRSFPSAVPRCNRDGKPQRAIFIGAKKLLREIDQDKLAIVFGRRIKQGNWLKGSEVIKPYWDFHANTRTGMSPVDPIEPRDSYPVAGEHLLQWLTGSYRPALPLNRRITGIGCFTRRRMFLARFSGRRTERRQDQCSNCGERSTEHLRCCRPTA
jgi:hypothetical protein